MPVSRLSGKKIHTIEGLPGLWAAKKKTSLTADTLHPVQAAWIEEQVPQCGYCQSGMMMAAAGLLKQNKNPSDADISSAMTNICRCGTYVRVRDAIHLAAKSA